MGERATPVDPPYCRVTVLSPATRVDVALPTDLPIAELVPMLMELLGEPRPGAVPVPWRLGGAAGGPLPQEATLAELGVLDGELLRLGPVGHEPPPPVFDDPVEALAATAMDRRPEPRGRAVAALLTTTAVAGALLFSARAAGGDAAPVVALGAAATVTSLTGAARIRRDAGDRRIALTAAVAAVLLGAATAAAAVPGAPGAGHMLAAAVAGGTVAAVAQALLRVVAPVLVAAVVTAVPVAVAAALRLRLGVEPATIAAGAGALALSAGPLLGRAAMRLAGLPRPVVPADSAELVAADRGPDLLAPAELAERAELARGYVAGTVGGTAAVAAVAALPAAMSGGWPGAAFAAVTVAVLALRSRGFADRAPVLTLQAAALGSGLALTTMAALTVGPPVRLAAAVGLLVVASAGAVIAARPERPSPITRRALDLLEGLLACVAVPLALGVMGVYGLVRGL